MPFESSFVASGDSLRIHPLGVRSDDDALLTGKPRPEPGFGLAEAPVALGLPVGEINADASTNAQLHGPA
jgi:hypothetical protein